MPTPSPARILFTIEVFNIFPPRERVDVPGVAAAIAHVLEVSALDKFTGARERHHFLAVANVVEDDGAATTVAANAAGVAGFDQDPGQIPSCSSLGGAALAAEDQDPSRFRSKISPP